MSTSKTPFSVNDDDINFATEAPPSSKPSSASVPSKSTEQVVSKDSAPQSAEESSKASLRAKLLSAAKNAAPAYTPSMEASTPAYTPSSAAPSSNATQKSAQQGSLRSSYDDFDPNNFDPLSGSGDYPPPTDNYDYEEYQGPPTDSESYNFDEDDDHTRDLCSNPCSQCGAIPSYVVYELCAECLDKVGPQ